MIAPSASEEPALLNWVMNGVAPLDGVADACATGGTFAGGFTVIVLVTLPLPPRLSVTVNFTV